MPKGIVIKGVGGIYEVLFSKNIYKCNASSKLKQNKNKIFIGDEVDFDILESNSGYIKNIHKRKNYLSRPPVSNIDQVIIIISLKEPEFSYYLLDMYLLQVLDNNIEPIIYFSKKDKVENLDDYTRKIKPYIDSGYKIFFGNSKDIKKNEEFYKLLENKKTIVTGQSGAGKSTFLNSLSKDLNIKTGEYSSNLGRGRHTTREVTFLNLHDGLIADTPGFSSLSQNIEKDRLALIFPCFERFAYDCKYRGCLHDKEPGCNIKKAVEENKIAKETYNDYLKILEEIRRNEK